jgi:hypothetical protein
MIQSIELFSGSGHVSQLLAARSVQVFKVDFNKKFDTQLCANIREITVNDLPDVCHWFWASPDCSKFSRAANQKHWSKKVISYRNYQYTPNTLEALEALKNLDKCIELIKHFNPAVWFIENPIGRIHHTAGMRSIGHYRYAVNYADWGFPYSKETFIFTNQLLPLPTSIPKSYKPGLRTVNSSYKRSLIPPALINFLIDHTINQCVNNLV